MIAAPRSFSRSLTTASPALPATLALLTLALLALAPPAPADAQDFAGSWCGRSAQDREVSFSVEGDTIAQARFGAQVSTPSCSSEVSRSGALFAPIVDGSFSVTTQIIDATLEWTGTFQSVDAVSGTLVLMDPFCDVTESTVWSAVVGECRPRVHPDPLQRNFGETPVGTSAALRKFTLTNEGTGDLEVSPIHLVGTDATQFTLPPEENSCQRLLLTPGESCQFRVGFEPTTIGSKTAMVAIASNDPETGEAHLLLRGIGVPVPSTLTADTPRRSFGEVSVGGTAAVRNLTLTNHGTRNVRIAPIQIRGAGRAHFTLPAGADRCSATILPPAGSCRLRIGFAPTATGAQRALAVIQSNDPGAGKIRVQLRGTGVAAGSIRKARDLVLVGGEILTLDELDTVASAVRIRDGVVVAVGDDVGPLEGPGVEAIDLGGRTVIPGLVSSGDDWQAAGADDWRLAYSLGITSVAARPGEGESVRMRRRYLGETSGPRAASRSTDRLAASPWLAIQAGVTEKMDRLDALRLFTRAGQDRSGSIEVGRRADLVVLSDDYLAVPDEEIGGLSSVLTLVEGVVVLDELADH